MKRNTILKDKTTVCLVMIVKNEENQLPRCFSTIKDHIDSWTIVDTGSTDNTIQVIKNELKDIPGQIIERPWVNFGHNRTEALNLASNKADYLLLCDADEQIVFLPQFNKNKLTADQYMVRYNGQLDYSVPYLLKSGINWRFVGVTHEYLEADKPTVREPINAIKINDYGDGGSKTDKFTRDIKLLENGLIQEPNNVRYMFYLANTYKNVSDFNNAIKWYQKRIGAGGWIEEVTCSYEYMGECYSKLNQIDKAITVWMEGYEFNPLRAECLYELVKALRIKGIHKIAWRFLLLAEQIKYPNDDILFIRKDVYEYLLDLEKTYLSYYVDNDKDIRDVFIQLLKNPNVNHIHLLSNYKFYSRDIQDFEIKNAGVNFNNIVGQYNGYVNSSPSIHKLKDGNYLVNVRRVSYTIGNDGSYHFLNKERKINTINTHTIINKDFVPISKPLHIDSLPKNVEKEINGLEDMRLIELPNGDFQWNANKWINEREIRVVVGTCKGSIDKIKEDAGVIINSPFNRQYEKNWCPFVHSEESLFIYSWDPIRIGKISENNLLIHKTLEDSFPHFRGSSPGYHNKKDNEYWFLVHTVEYSTPRHYYHAIMILDDKTLKPKKCSKLFTFEGKKIEFGLGLIVNESEIIMTYSTWDSTSKLKVYNKEKLINDVFS